MAALRRQITISYGRPKWRIRDIRAVVRDSGARGELEYQRVAGASGLLGRLEKELAAQEEAWAVLREIQDRSAQASLRLVPGCPERSLCLVPAVDAALIFPAGIRRQDAPDHHDSLVL